MRLGMTESGLAAGNTQHGTMWSRELNQSSAGIVPLTTYYQRAVLLTLRNVTRDTNSKRLWLRPARSNQPGSFDLGGSTL